MQGPTLVVLIFLHHWHTGAGWQVKIADFGMSRMLDGGETSHASAAAGGSGSPLLCRTLSPGVIGTAAYCAPELLGVGEVEGEQAERQDVQRLLKADVSAWDVTGMPAAAAAAAAAATAAAVLLAGLWDCQLLLPLPVLLCICCSSAVCAPALVCAPPVLLQT